MTKFRSFIQKDEFWNVDQELEHFILGDCHGVGFHKRGPSDNHVMILFLAEDDGQWFVSTCNSGCSSFWLTELQELLQAAEQWLNKHCKKDAFGYGWEFKH